MVGIIYMYENPINGKCYIGRTTDLQKRHREHKRMTSKKHSKFGHALNKYGIESFNVKVILTITATEDFNLSDILNSFEKYYIEKYKTFTDGYNTTMGGEGTIGFSRKGILSPSYGTKMKPHVQYALNSARWIPVSQYDKKSGYFINSFKSIKDASVNVCVDETHISLCCRGKRKSAGGFIWRHSVQNIN